MHRSIMSLVAVLLLFSACSDNSSNTEKISYRTEAKTALIVVVENNDGLEYSMYQNGFQLYKEEMLRTGKRTARRRKGLQDRLE